MFLLIVTLCTSSAMADCQEYTTGRFPTQQQCLAMAGLQRDLLGEAANYSIKCEPENKE